MIVPWPRTKQAAAEPSSGSAAAAAVEEPWDASRGIGDWRARMQKIYDAEAAESDNDSDDDENEDTDGEREAADTVVPRYFRRHLTEPEGGAVHVS